MLFALYANNLAGHTMIENQTLGFVGLGVMGEPICRHLAQKSGRPVLGFDVAKEPLERLEAFNVGAAGSVAALAEACWTVFLALPSGAHVQQVCEGPGGLLQSIREGQHVVDLGTSPVELTRRLAEEFSKRGAIYADAPIARTRQAAEAGALSVMAGCAPETFAALRPLLACFATDITHCGPVGNGQTVKILNNMVLIQTVVALSEAMAVARSSGMDGALLFETLAKGSADSFALRNHGMKAIVPENFPERAFSAHYALKDLSYVLALAGELGLKLDGAALAASILQKAIDAGDGDRYWPVIAKTIGPRGQ